MKARKVRYNLKFGGLFIALGAPGAAQEVALTFDDVPVYGRPASAVDASSITSHLLAGLRHHRLIATGFVNEVQLEGPDRPARVAVLAQWLNAGMTLGNHTYSHLSLTRVPVDAYVADIERGEQVIGRLLLQRGCRIRWFRPPYLETGATAEARQQLERWLQSHSYRIAPLTMENTDWLFALPYNDAVARQDKRQADRIRRAYLDYTRLMVRWYRAAALDLLGRQPAFVFLLHASRLNAASIDGLAAILAAQNLHVVSLDRAMSDAAYQTPDTYVGPNGEGWLTRWAASLHKALPWGTLPKPPEEITAASARLAGSVPGDSKAQHSAFGSNPSAEAMRISIALTGWRILT